MGQITIQSFESLIDFQTQEQANHLTTIMNSCATKINRAINNLISDVWELQAKERNELMETVNSLKEKLSLIEQVQGNVDSENVIDLDSPDESD